MIEKCFHLSEHGTNVKTEFIAGLTTFLAMAYILAVNPNILSASGMDASAVFTATALSAGIATLCMAFFANYPVALASGMGLNAYFVTVCGNIMAEHPWEIALTAVLVEGIIFILLSFTNFREKLVNDIPSNLKYAISVGIGLFITIIGLKNSGAVVDLGLGNITNPAVCLSLVGILVIAYMAHKNIKGAVFYGILITWGLGIIAELIGWYVPDAANGIYSVMPVFSLASIGGLKYAFSFDFTWMLNHMFEFIVIVFSFLYVDIFDTCGTLIGVATKAGLTDENNNLPNAKGALLADAVGTCVGACLGTSTVTSYVESSAGAGVGGRTGLTAVFSGLMFFVSLLFAPLFLSIPSFATTPALVYVGYLMMTNIKNVKFEDVPMSDIISAFLAIVMMPFTSSIANGIMFGIISWVILRICERRTKEIPAVMWISAGLFIIYMLVG